MPSITQAEDFSGLEAGDLTGGKGCLWWIIGSVILVAYSYISSCFSAPTKTNYIPTPAETPFPTYDPYYSQSETAQVEMTEWTLDLTVAADNCVCAKRDINIRSGPGVNYKTDSSLYPGQCVQFLGENQDATWTQIDGGWVRSDLVKRDQPCTSVVRTASTLPASIPTGSKPASQCPIGCTTQASGCDIKGNISFNAKEKIYHMPGDKFYVQTTINPAYGERWFCTPQEAEANGWRRAEQ